jgi:thiol:disulfide interchange protein DsbD
MMKRWVFILSVMLGGTALALSAQVHQGRRIVTPRLVADVAAVQPGRPFTVGLYFQIEPGWHMYWENSGRCRPTDPRRVDRA